MSEPHVLLSSRESVIAWLKWNDRNGEFDELELDVALGYVFRALAEAGSSGRLEVLQPAAYAG